MATKLGIYNGTLGILKTRRLNALTDDIEERYVLDQFYDDVIEWMLEQGYWNFASRFVAITADAGVETSFGHTHAFAKPDDWVRTVRMSMDERMFTRLEDADFTDEQLYWYASVEPLYVQYISNGTSYGLDVANWPHTISRIVEFELAVRVAPQIMSLSDAAIERLEGRRDRYLKDARSKDAMNQGAMRPPTGRLVQARMGSRTSAGQSPWWRN